MKNKFQHTKPIADLLTLTRFILGFSMAILGIVRSSDGLGLAVYLVLLSWLTDILDGRLARRDSDAQDTWLGRHEAEADLSTSIGVAIFLIFSGYMPILLGVMIVIIMPAVWLLHSHQLGWPLYAIPYVILIITAFQNVPHLGWLMVVYLLATLLIQYLRLAGEHLPEFFQTLTHLRKNDR